MNWRIAHLFGARKVPVITFLTAFLSAISMVKGEVVFTGTVIDVVTEQPIPGVSLFVGVDSGLGETDETGNFSFSLKEAGTFDVRAFKVGYELAFIQGIKFQDGKPTEMDVKLLPLGSQMPLTRDPNEPLEEIDEGVGAVSGTVSDADTRRGISFVSVELRPGATISSSTPAEDILTVYTDSDGDYRFEDVPSGYYSLRFEADGYRSWTLEDIAVKPDETVEWDVPLGMIPDDSEGEVYELGDFVVSAEVVSRERIDFQMLREQSINMVDLFSAEDFSRFAAGDVAAALTRVVGVNIVEGQFAIIRGLEDRYSSTTYNGAPVPSPDPTSQSVQLDLFPSEIVSNLAIAKTFVPNLPSNSSGGSIDIITHDYPAENEAELSLGTGFNSNARERFIQFVPNSATGRDGDGIGMTEHSYSGYVGGRAKLFGRDVRYKALLGDSRDFSGQSGYQEKREPFSGLRGLLRQSSGDLAFGELNLSDGYYDLTHSSVVDQTIAYLGAGIDLDKSSRHKIDGSIFYTKKDEASVRLLENGYLPNFDYTPFAEQWASGDDIRSSLFFGFATESAWPTRIRTERDDFTGRGGGVWFAPYFDSRSFSQERDLFVVQLNGQHSLEAVQGLNLNWSANHAETNQNEVSFGLRYFYEPDDYYITPETILQVQDLMPGRYAAPNRVLSSTNDISEEQDFGKLDADYSFALTNSIEVDLLGGLYYEKASRSVGSDYLESASRGGRSEFATFGEDPVDLGLTIMESLSRDAEGNLSGTRNTTNDSSKEAKVGYFNTVFKIHEKWEFTAGVRFENLELISNNDPFTGEYFDPFTETMPKIFPTKYLFFDRMDNPSIPVETFGSPSPYNDQLLGIDVPVDPDTGYVDLSSREEIEALVNGRIEESNWLPSAGFVYRPTEAVTVRGSWSQTVARPSFREMGYYVSVELGSSDLVVGNPQLQLSEVESWDLRAEYVDQETSDLVALSVFAKTIQRPIEVIVVRNPLNAERSSQSALFRTFFNNPNDADLVGVEFEFRKGLGFIPLDFLDYFSVGGNFTYIDAEVARSQAEVERAADYFELVAADTREPLYDSLADSRRLFGQPEWIGNADIEFDQPDWGTKVTLALFAISDVLDAAGNASISNVGQIYALTLDSYIASYHQLDLIFRQTLGDFSLKVTAKNLTNTDRKIIYDPYQTADEVAERSVKVGRDYSISISYAF